MQPGHRAPLADHRKRAMTGVDQVAQETAAAATATHPSRVS